MNSLKEGLLRTVEEVLGRQRKKTQPWVTNEVLDLCHKRQRQQLKQQKYTSTEAELEYRKVNREVWKKMKAAKREWIEEQCNNIKKGMMSENNKEAYNTIRLSARPNNIVSSHRRQQWKHPGGEHSRSKPVD